MAELETAPARIQPMLDTFSAPYWAAAKQGKFVVQRSVRTGQLQWPPRPRMLPDWEDEVEWVEVKGKGAIYSYSIIYRSSHRYPPTPYVIAIVELECGVPFMTNIVGVDPETVHIGMEVSVEFEHQSDEISLAVFRPTGKTSSA